VLSAWDVQKEPSCLVDNLRQGNPDNVLARIGVNNGKCTASGITALNVSGAQVSNITKATP